MHKQINKTFTTNKILKKIRIIKRETICNTQYLSLKYEKYLSLYVNVHKIIVLVN